jgi:hypothetical protein
VRQRGALRAPLKTLLQTKKIPPQIRSGLEKVAAKQTDEAFISIIVISKQNFRFTFYLP